MDREDLDCLFEEKIRIRLKCGNERDVPGKRTVRYGSDLTARNEDYHSTISPFTVR